MTEVHKAGADHTHKHQVGGHHHTAFVVHTLVEVDHHTHQVEDHRIEEGAAGRMPQRPWAVGHMMG